MARLQRLQLSAAVSSVKNGAAICQTGRSRFRTADRERPGRLRETRDGTPTTRRARSSLASEPHTKRNAPRRRLAPEATHITRHAGCRDAFLAFDKDRSGTIDVWELRQVLEAMGQKPTEEELFQMISEVDENMSGSIDFAEFLKVIENQKERAENFDDENDMIDAFVACGGEPDKGGHVRRETLVKIIKHDFGLTIDIEELINKIDTDLSGEIEFEEFKALLS